MKTADQPGNKAEAGREAADRFDQIENVAAKMAIVEHAVNVHGGSLKRRHLNLMMVSPGYRARRSGAGRYELHKQPCVVLTVERKWKPDEVTDLSRHLPERLEVSISVGNRVVQYMVPTDVQPQEWTGNLRTQSSNGITVETSPPCSGAITCGVELGTSAGPMWLALSALHVLTPAPCLDAIPKGSIGIELSGAGAAVGQSTPYAGCLRWDAPSFDAQLATISPARLNSMFADLRLDFFQIAHSRADINFLASVSQFYVHTSTNRLNGPIPDQGDICGQFCFFADDSLKLVYTVTDDQGTKIPAYITHPDLIVIAAGDGKPVTQEGDSGSPVFASYNNQTFLVGMLIAGPQTGNSGDRMVVLPSWVLFNPANWSSLPPKTKSIRPTFHMP
ncbi:hypothetical protein [Duganella sp. S19_KUP01_CR8]|uniref:hypothetical protein n=1 Tax=Duganella sp. S19_KUP01_CR8 TaxID=3025502 RepID=UPI002FCDB60B